MAQHFSTPIQETQDIHLINEIEKLRTKLAEYERRIQCGINENKELRRQLNESEYIRNEDKKAIEKLERKIELLKNGQLRTLQEYQKLQEKFDDLWRGNEFLNAIIEQFKDTHLEHLQCSGQLCANNCFLCTILWICQKKLGVFPCGLQLLLLLFKYKSAEEIRPENHVCQTLIMEIFIKCGIVTEADQFKYPSELNAKLQVIDQAWNTLMTKDGSVRVMILGRVIAAADAQGHAEVCDLDSKTSDGRVTIHNPQRDERGEANQEDFRNHVIKDEGLILFEVNLEKLKQIFEKCAHILHHTVQPNQGFTSPSGVTDGVQ
jgi:Txe/YoeB family toxin of Txe-Axe toxin-antitoxin module